MMQVLRGMLLMSSAISARAVLIFFKNNQQPTNTTNTTTTDLIGSFETAAYVHFGPDDKIVSGQVIILDGNTLCKPGDAVREKIVVSFAFDANEHIVGRACPRNELYLALHVSLFGNKKQAFEMPEKTIAWALSNSSTDRSLRNSTNDLRQHPFLAAY